MDLCVSAQYFSAHAHNAEFPTALFAEYLLHPEARVAANL